MIILQISLPSIQVAPESNSLNGIRSNNSIDQMRQVVEDKKNLNIPEIPLFDTTNIWRQHQISNGNSASIKSTNTTNKPLMDLSVLSGNSFKIDPTKRTDRSNGTKYVTNLSTKNQFSVTNGNSNFLHGLFIFCLIFFFFFFLTFEKERVYK